jgi:hypothetical protein
MAGLLQAVLAPSGSAVGWVVHGDPLNHFGDRAIHVGILEGRVYHGAVQFDLAAIPVESTILHATIEFIGMSAQNLEPEAGGTWSLHLLSPELDEDWSSVSYEQLHNAPVAHTLSPQMSAQQLAAGRVNAFTLTLSLLGALEERLESGRVSFRLDGPSQGPNNLFTWDTNTTGGFVSWPVLRVIYQPPSTPTPTASVGVTDVIRQAEGVSTPTLLPADAVTKTVQVLARSTPTSEAVRPFAVATSPRATASPTAWPLAIVTATPPAFPQALLGKIAFHSDRLGGDRIYVMDPDGSNVAPLTDEWVYEAALAAQIVSSDGRTTVQAGWKDNSSDVFRVDPVRNRVVRITWLAGGTSSDPAWSPDSERVAFVSSQDGDDEIFIVLRSGSVARQLTYNELKWDVRPTWSPDGTRLAYASSDTGGRRQIWTINFDGTRPQNISDNDHDDWGPVWIRPASSAILVTPTPPPAPTRRVVPPPAPSPSLPAVEVVITGVNKRNIVFGLQHDDLEISGSGFQAGARVLLRYAGRADILADDASVFDDSLIRCRFDLRGLALPYAQEWTLRVENPDGQAAQTVVWIGPPSNPPSEPPTRPEH